MAASRAPKKHAGLFGRPGPPRGDQGSWAGPPWLCPPGYIYIYIYIYIGGEGVRSKWNGEPPYREIDFGFVFVPCVRARRSCVGGREESLLWLRRGRTK